MIYNQDLPDYSHDMYLKGFNAYQIFEANRRTNRKKLKKKREESILEKELFNFIEGVATTAVNEAMDDIFEGWK